MGDPMFEGCSECGFDNMFNGQANSAMYCLECDDGYHNVDWRMGEKRCVRHDMYWDCTPQAAINPPAATTAVATTVMPRPAMPQGPDNCDMCFMVSHEMACAHCKPGFMVDPMTMECVPDQPANGPNAP